MAQVALCSENDSWHSIGHHLVGEGPYLIQPSGLEEGRWESGMAVFNEGLHDVL